MRQTPGFVNGGWYIEGRYATADAAAPYYYQVAILPRAFLRFAPMLHVPNGRTKLNLFRCEFRFLVACGRLFWITDETEYQPYDPEAVWRPAAGGTPYRDYLPVGPASERGDGPTPVSHGFD